MILKETEFRIEELRKKVHQFDGKRIALYGTGDNAKYILEDIPELDIEVLIDDKKAGRYMYGKYVISLKQAKLLAVDVIIIAAEAVSAKAVSDRIADFCIDNNIGLFSMYGSDEIARKRYMLEQTINYPDFSREQIKEMISKHDTILVEARDLLWGLEYINDEGVLRSFAEKLEYP